jgi:hypothetical protein
MCLTDRSRRRNHKHTVNGIEDVVVTDIESAKPCVISLAPVVGPYNRDASGKQAR